MKTVSLKIIFKVVVKASFDEWRSEASWLCKAELKRNNSRENKWEDIAEICEKRMDI